jgi:predicted membrane chloride channel (bestrophin family)
MAFYYQTSEPIYRSAVTALRTGTIFGLVMKRLEFWSFLLFHVLLLIFLKTDLIPRREAQTFKWEAVGASQFFVTLFLSFFIGYCFDRYKRFYNLCMDVIDSCLLFVHEIVVSFPGDDFEQHRTTAVKYVLSMAHLFFMTTGAKLEKQEWMTFVQKGLLTRPETEALEAFPAKSFEAIMVLASWTMYTVDDALLHPTMHDGKVMNTTHCHDRANVHVVRLMRSCQEIGSLISLPIPMPYFNLMNWMLFCNALMISGMTAFLVNWFTIIPVAFGLLFFFGMREISSCLANPFGGTTDMDMPVASFLAFTYDNSICLLEALRSPESVSVSRMLKYQKDFTNPQFFRETAKRLYYTGNYDVVTGNPFAWNKEHPMQSMAGIRRGPTEYFASINEAAFAGDKSAADLPFGDELEEDVAPVAKKESLREKFARIKGKIIKPKKVKERKRRKEMSGMELLLHELRQEQDKSKILEFEITEVSARVRINRAQVEARGILKRKADEVPDAGIDAFQKSIQMAADQEAAGRVGDDVIEGRQAQDILCGKAPEQAPSTPVRLAATSMTKSSRALALVTHGTPSSMQTPSNARDTGIAPFSGPPVDFSDFEDALAQVRDFSRNSRSQAPTAPSALAAQKALREQPQQPRSAGNGGWGANDDDDC